MPSWKSTIFSTILQILNIIFFKENDFIKMEAVVGKLEINMYLEKPVVNLNLPENLVVYKYPNSEISGL